MSVTILLALCIQQNVMAITVIKSVTVSPVEAVKNSIQQNLIITVKNISDNTDAHGNKMSFSLSFGSY